MRLAPGSLVLIAALAQPAGAQTVASIGGVLVNRESRAPVEGARIAVLGTGQVTITDATGRFELASVPSGVRVLQARAIGFSLSSWLIELREGQAFRDTFDIGAVALTVDEIRVTGDANDWRSEAAFERRRIMSGGFFITRDEIQRRRPANLSDLIRAVPGATLMCRGMGNNNCFIQLVRSARLCPPEYFLDGHPATNSTGANFPIDIASIRGVEVYRGAGEMPQELSRLNNRCGVIAIWTIDTGERLHGR